jgi:hypothetical protein
MEGTVDHKMSGRTNGNTLYAMQHGVTAGIDASSASVSVATGRGARSHTGWRRAAGAGLVMVGALLGGCASYVTSNVTAFQDWRGSDAQRTYVFQTDPARQNDLEEASYETLVAQTLSTYGFTQVPRAQAHYAVNVAFGQRETTGYAPQAIYPGGPFAYDPVWRGRRGWGPSPFWAAPPTIVSLPYAASVSELTIRIKTLDDGKEVYKVTARHVGDATPLPVVMPFLVRSALFDFPMPNGTVRNVKLPADRHNPATNAGM